MLTIRAERRALHLAISASFALAIVGGPGCSTQDGFSFEQLQSCTSVLQEAQGQVRILFMVDNSGSTSTTDPNHDYRAQTISTFLSQFGSKTNFSYSFGY